MGVASLDSILTIRKALEALIKIPDDIPSDASAHIEELDKMIMNLKMLQKFFT